MTHATSSPPPRRLSGFTLIEMMLVVAVIGIGLAVALPRVRAIILRQQVDRSAQIVASDIRAAFTSAARGRVPVTIAFSSSSAKYAILNTVTGDTIIRRDLGAGDLSVAGVSASATTFTIFPSGVATGTDTVTVAGAGYSRQISVSRVGFVRVLSPATP